MVYQRAKGQLDKRPFGTQLEVYNDGFEWLQHSIAAREPANNLPRVKIGGPDCTCVYDASLLNISAMSFGSLSANAIKALNRGARMGGFAHDTGEGGLSPYHLEGGGDLIWEIGSGYFTARNADGSFSPEGSRKLRPSIRSRWWSSRSARAPSLGRAAFSRPPRSARR